MNSKNVQIKLGEEVADALAEDRAVVALESNVITHGLKPPMNLRTAVSVEEAVRSTGATPATTWLQDGIVRVGATHADLEHLASSSNAPKASSRDMSIILSSKGLGSTTVAASLVIAELSGITFFSSAGIGGVHRNAQQTMDISADLIQLTRSKVAVVCAGAKNILDLNLTLEFLETQCVPVIGYQSDDFPAFYCVSSGLRSPHRLDDERTTVQAIKTAWDLGYSGSVLVTQPIREEDAIPEREVNSVIEQAIRTAEQQGIAGSAITKHIMRAVDDATSGRSSSANASVLISTAELAGKLSVSYQRRRQEDWQ